MAVGGSVAHVQAGVSTPASSVKLRNKNKNKHSNGAGDPCEADRQPDMTKGKNKVYILGEGSGTGETPNTGLDRLYRQTIGVLFFDVKDQKLRANYHWISGVLNSDGYSFKSSGSWASAGDQEDTSISQRCLGGYRNAHFLSISSPRRNSLWKSPLQPLDSCGLRSN
ncbi:hypothetical protein L3X38_007233 [Prunus dulcis]|uniref:Uncharacterized protein n=1 Tax=Prunus dulcis TaxID=3755 RepID=A0AAD4ZU43_PRUDU|nr:hypothetical protein L3X38_007233 [Prunus dulcis]